MIWITGLTLRPNYICGQTARGKLFRSLCACPPPWLAILARPSLTLNRTWQGLGDIINIFRTDTLGLEPLTQRSGPSALDRLKIPWTYCWSEGLIDKPKDWKEHIDISGFYFLDAESEFKPDQALLNFLHIGPPPIYIGFGSVVVEDPETMTQTILDAVKIAGVRALVSAGWGGLGGAKVSEEVFILEGKSPASLLAET